MPREPRNTVSDRISPLQSPEVVARQSESEFCCNIAGDRHEAVHLDQGCKFMLNLQMVR